MGNNKSKTKITKITNIIYNKHCRPYLWNITFEMKNTIKSKNYKKKFYNICIYTTNNTLEAKTFLKKNIGVPVYLSDYSLSLYYSLIA